MKIYIVTDGDYSDYHIEAVFTDKGVAEKYAALHSCNSVEEWDTDTTEIKGAVQPYVVHKFRAWLKHRSLESEGTYYSERKFKNVYPSSISKDYVNIYVSLPKYDYYKATKIAQDLYAKHLYERSENDNT